MNFSELMEQGTVHAWLYLPMAVLLGALHGLEPGHSKTMMAAFIIAVRGTVAQAALLGLSAAVSHSLVIWALAAVALKFGNRWSIATTEPYFLIATGLAVIGMSAWTFWRLRRGGGHHHHDEERRLAHADGEGTLSIFEETGPPRFRLTTPEGVAPIALRTIREDGAVQDFTFNRRILFWESNETIPEPHHFRVESVLNGPSGEQAFHSEFVEHTPGGEDDDAHAREHAEQIQRRFVGRKVTTGQIVLFGLTGGLMPCPAAFTILLVCLQVKRFTLGFSMVAAFSLGLAITLVTVGVIAAWGIRRVAKKSGGFGLLAQRAPYVSSGILAVLGLVFIVRGVLHLA